MTTINAYLTKDQQGSVELWQSKPKYDRENGIWVEGVKTEVGSDICDTFL